MSAPTFIDLFAGAGGLSEGFLRAGFKPVAHVESDTAASFTLKTRAAYYYLKDNHKIALYKSYMKGDITREELYKAVPQKILDSVINTKIGVNKNKKIFETIDSLIEKKKVDLIIGGPPCQAYSVIGRAVDKNKMKNDKRNFLYRDYGMFLRKYKPSFFVFENVKGLSSAKGKKRKYLTNMLKNFREAGYKVDYRIQNAVDFGVLQNRKRIIIIGWKKSIKFSYPEFVQENHSYIIENIFSDLPVLKAGQGKDKAGSYKTPVNNYLDKYLIRNGIETLTQHIARPHIQRDKKIYAIAVKKWNKNKERLVYSDLPEELITHKNKYDFQDRFKVVAADEKTSHTVLAHIAKDGHYYIHPDLKQNRSISVREAARLQSFPDDYYFEGEKEGRNRTSAFKQIGNAVPPLMAYGIAKRLGVLLSNILYKG